MGSFSSGAAEGSGSGVPSAAGDGFGSAVGAAWGGVELVSGVGAAWEGVDVTSVVGAACEGVGLTGSCEGDEFTGDGDGEGRSDGESVSSASGTAVAEGDGVGVFLGFLASVERADSDKTKAITRKKSKAALKKEYGLNVSSSTHRVLGMFLRSVENQ
jgi:hypothetical protein